jgi:peptidoglycan/LPS O-acetylase OafA/YrhL
MDGLAGRGVDMAVCSSSLDWSLKSPSDKMLHLDVLRLIASVCVVAYHYRYSIDPYGLWALVPDRIAPFHLFVDLFFVISGYVIAYIYFDKTDRKNSYAHFLQRRVARLLPLHWATWAFYVFAFLLIALSGKHVNHPPQWTAAVWQFPLLHVLGGFAAEGLNVPSWSISAEMMLYVAFPLMVMAARRSVYVTFGLAGFLLVVLFALSGGFPATVERPWYDHTFDFGLARALPSFLVGLGLFQVRGRLACIPCASTLVWFALTAFFVGALLLVSPSYLILLIYLVAVLAVAADQQATSNGLVRRAAQGGALTYSIYMLHAPMQYLLIYGVARGLLHLSGILMNLAHLAVMMAVVVAAYFSLVFFERPARNWINSIDLGKSLSKS